MSDPVDLEALVREVVLEQFGVGIDCTISVKADRDSYGDPILRITIAADPITALHVEGMAGFVRHLRSRLAIHHIDDFPMVSYVSKIKAGRRKLAAH